MVQAVTTDVSQTTVLMAGNYPAETAGLYQMTILAATESDVVLDVSQATIMMAALGRTDNPTVRVWTFTLDGHDMYVIHLGTIETLVYDTHSQQWYVWSSGLNGTGPWRANDGTNWDMGTGALNPYGTNVVCGDDTNGALYVLNPNYEQDDDALVGSETPRSFKRVAYAQAVARGYDRQPANNIELLGSIGDLAATSLTGITLEYSDDRGNTFVDAGTVDVDDGDYQDRVTWRGLGSYRAPGRLFRVTDYGALRRLDSLDLNDD